METVEERNERIELIKKELKSYQLAHPNVSEEKIGRRFDALFELDLQKLRVISTFKNNIINGKNKNSR